MGDKRNFIQLPESHFRFALLSHKGWVRTNNEDRLAVSEFATNGDDAQPVLAAVLCDGVGGHRAGEVAAHIGVDTVANTIKGRNSLENPLETLENAVIAANQAVLQAYGDQPELDGMAATCVSTLIVGRKLYLANLGDSRAYLLRKGKLLQLSHDHTWLKESASIELGEFSGITREHPLAHVLSRYLGTPHPADVDLRLRTMKKPKGDETANQGMGLKKGDHLLLCSDGVTDLLGAKDIAGCMCSDSPRKDAQRLVLSALEKGGHDNASVIVIFIT